DLERGDRDRQKLEGLAYRAVVPHDLLQSTLADRRGYEVAQFVALSLRRRRNADEREPAVAVAQLETHVERRPEIVQLAQVRCRCRREADEIVLQLRVGLRPRQRLDLGEA